MLMIASIKFEFNTKTYDYLIYRSDITIKAGTLLKDPYGTSAHGPLYKYLTVVETKTLDSIKELPHHVTKFLVVDKEFRVSKYQITEMFIKGQISQEEAKVKEVENKDTIKSARISIDIVLPAIKSAAMNFASSIDPDKQITPDEIKNLKINQDMVIDEVVKIYKLNGNKITGGAFDLGIETYLTNKDTDERDKARSYILWTLLNALDPEYDVVDWTKIW